jgi:hypothetical protein
LHPICFIYVFDRDANTGIGYSFQLSDAVGMMGVFIIFGVFALLEAVFIYLALPETKDRALQEIEDYFQVSETWNELILVTGHCVLSVIIFLQQSNLLWVTRTRERKENVLMPANDA